VGQTQERRETMTENEAIQYYANLYFQYEAFYQAAVRAARQAGEDRARNAKERFWESMLLYSEGRRLPVFQQRLQNSLPTHARIGATAYVRGEQGNYYTFFLYQNFGPYQSRGEG
jgi:hypothetical protein